MSRIYVASSWRNDFQPGVVRKLREDGHLVYDFKGDGDGWGGSGTGPGGFHWSEIDPEWQSWPVDIPRYLRGLNHPRAVEGYRRDMDALLLSDACVMVMPCGPSASMEMGWASGSGRFVAVYIPGMREPDLMVKMADYVGSDLSEIRQLIRQRCELHSDMVQRAVARWYRSAGGHATPLDAAKRAQKEVSGLISALESGDTTHAKEELADSGICLDIVAESLQCSLSVVKRWKLGINEQREWTVMLDGTLTHVKGTDPRDRSSNALA